MELAERKHGRNGTLDVVKFISCLFIVFYHFNIYTDTKQYFSGGQFGVEIFCMISGVFFFEKYRKNSETITTWEYAKERFWRFFPYTTVSFIILYLFYEVTGNGHNLSTHLEHISEYIWEILLVDMIGLNQGGAFLNFPTWTISCLLIVECIILGFLICSRRAFFNLIAPVSLMIFYGVWSNLDSPNYRTWLGIINFGILQVWCAVVWGIFAVLAAEKLKKITKISKLLTVIEMVCYCVSGMIMLTTSRLYWRFILTLLIFVAISISLSQRSYSGYLFKDSKFTRWLASLSFAIYLTHSLLLKIFQTVLSPEQMMHFWPLFLVTLVAFSSVFDQGMKIIIRFFRSKYIQVKKHYGI